MRNNGDEEKTEPSPKPETAPAANEAKKPASKPKKVAAKSASTSKKATSTSEKEDTTMAKSKTARKPTARTASKARAGGGNRALIPGDAKIIPTGKENPFREGSGAYDRTEKVLKNKGKTRDEIEKLTGILGSTIPNLIKLKVIKTT